MDLISDSAKIFHIYSKAVAGIRKNNQKLWSFQEDFLTLYSMIKKLMSDYKVFSEPVEKKLDTVLSDSKEKLQALIHQRKTLKVWINDLDAFITEFKKELFEELIYYETYDLFSESSRDNLNKARFIPKIANSKEPLLEIGPGTGPLLKRLTDWNYDVYGIERDKRMIELIRSKVPSAHNKLIHGDFLKTSIKHKFHTIFIESGFIRATKLGERHLVVDILKEYSSTTIIVEMLKKIHSLLQNDGVFLVDVQKVMKHVKIEKGFHFSLKRTTTANETTRAMKWYFKKIAMSREHVLYTKKEKRLTINMKEFEELSKQAGFDYFYTDLHEEWIVLSKQEIINGRRNALRMLMLGAGGVVVASSLPLRTLAQVTKPFVNEKLYDLQLGKFSSETAAKNHISVVQRKIAPELKQYVLSWPVSKSEYYVVLNINAPYSIAKRIAKHCNTHGVNCFIHNNFKWSYPADAKVNNNTVLPLTNSTDKERTLVLTYLTAFSNDDIIPTIRGLKRDKRRTYIDLPTKWLRPYLRESKIYGKDYFGVRINNKNLNCSSLSGIVSNYTLYEDNNVTTNITRILNFNGILENQIKNLWDGVLIAIPADIANPAMFDMDKVDPEPEPIPEPEPTPKPSPNNGLLDKTIAKQNTKLMVHSGKYYVLRANTVKVPSVIIESFFLSNLSDTNYFKNDNNIRHFAKKVAQGIYDYARLNKKNAVILAGGHGDGDPGNVAYRGGVTYKERYFIKKIQPLVRDYLSPYIKVHYLWCPKRKYMPKKYQDTARYSDYQHARLHYYVDEANKFAAIKGVNTFYVEIHVDSSTHNTVSGTRLYPSMPVDKNPSSFALAIAILTQVQKK